MQSRLRKPRKSFDNYESAIQKQLNDDFQVYEYLNLNNIEGDNIDDYIKLFNSLLVQKNKKKKTLQSLQVNFQQMASDNQRKSLQSSKIQTWGGAKQLFTNQYEEIQIQTSTQLQVKNNLWKQIIQTKKSLNLLKGDIGHLVSRNEAAKLLQSKMNKAKIVADDQYKRVSMAFIKDKQEIKLRSEMQKKFNKKLNNVSMYEDNTLVKCKKNYLDSMIKKKEIFDRLNYIEKVSASINQSGELQKLKNIKNRRTLELFQYLLKIQKLIEKAPQIQKGLTYTAQSLHEFSTWLKNEQNYFVKLPQLPFDSSIIIKSTRKIKLNSTCTPCLNSQDLRVITEEALSNALQKIFKQYQRLSQEIERSISIYNEHMKKNEEIINKIQKYEQQQEQILKSFSLQIQSGFKIRRQERFQYQQKLKKFISFLKVIFALLEYLEKNINYSSIHLNSLQLKKTPSDDSQYQRSLIDLNMRMAMTQQNPKESRSILVTQNQIRNNYQKNYISQLHKNYYTLLFNDSDSISHNLHQISEQMYDDLKYDLNCWFQMLKDNFINGKSIKYPAFVKKQETNTNKKIRLRKQSSKILLRNNSMLQNKTQLKGESQQEDINLQQKFNNQAYKRCHTIHREDGIQRNASLSKASSMSANSKFRSKNQSIHRKSAHNFGTSKLINVNKLKNQSIKYQKAQRIQLLEDIDKDYYKMLKYTIKMQKQNTRKNYQFLRTFKRAKYSSRDQILEQKRFQSSYSMLFSNKRASESIRIENKLKSKKSAFYKAEQDEKINNRMSKLTNQVRKSCLQSSQGLKNSTENIDQLKENVKKINMNKDRNSGKVSLNKSRLSIKLKDVLNLI